MNFRRAFQWTSVTLGLLVCNACMDRRVNPREETLPAFKPGPAKSFTPTPVSAEPSSFAAVSQLLDTNGSFFLYLSTEAFLKRAAVKLQQFEPLLLSAAKLDVAGNERAEAAWNSLGRLTQASGVNEISGVGVSSIALRPGYFHSKWVLHHYENKGRGFLWRLVGAPDNALDLASYLPRETALAASVNLSFGPTWNALLQEATENPELGRGLQGLGNQVEQLAGFPMDRLLQAVGPNYSLILTLDKDRKVSMPWGEEGKPVLIPEPGVALLVQVQDPALILRLAKELGKMPGLVITEQNGIKIRLLPAPKSMPSLHPAVAWRQGTLMVASQESLLREILQVKLRKIPGLAAQPEYKTLMEGMPSRGSQFYLAAPLFHRTAADLELSIQQSRVEPAVGRILHWARASVDERWMCGVLESTPEGLVGNVRGDGGPARFMELSAAVPMAALSTLAMPTLERLRKRSQAARILEDLQLIQAALEQFALENEKPAGFQVQFEDLKPYFKTGSPLFDSKNRDVLGHSFNDGAPYVIGQPPKVNPATFADLQDVVPASYWGTFKK